MSDEVRTRFAPSPTGYLHLGGLRTALYTYLFAKKHGGKFILRIEDTDQEREVPGAVDLIYKSMRQAGLTYDEGPDVGGEYGPYIQTQRRDLYPKYAWELVEKGGAYCCFCTKEELEADRKAAEAKGETYKYNKKCLHNVSLEEAKRRIAAGEPYVIRQNVPTTGKASFDDMLYGHVEVDCDTLDDNVLIKADGLPTYNFANVVDDHLMAISHVMRGTEYLSSAPKYNLLYEAFGWTPPTYIHLPVVMRDATRKLSKRYGDPSFEDLLDMGYLRDAIINFIALLGWCPDVKKYGDKEFFTKEELIEAFDLSGLSKSPAIFNTEKLDWFNHEYITRMSPDEYLELATPWFDKVLAGKNMDYRMLASLMHTRTEVFNRVPDQIRFLAELPEYDIDIYTHKKMKTDPEISLKALKLALPALEALEDFSEENVKAVLMELAQKNEMKTGQIMWPVRIAISGLQSTPGGATEIAYLLGKDETLRRMKLGVEKLEQHD